MLTRCGRFVVLVLTPITWAAGALAQTYPVKPIRIVVGNAPGSSGDIVARLIAPALGERLGQAVVVENRAGAGTMIGSETVAKAAPDGYTLLMAFSTLAINPAMYKKVPFDAIRDFAPITHAVNLPGLMCAHPSLPAKNAKDLIALAKARPNQIVFGSAGQGSWSHVSTELFVTLAGIRMLHVPYKGTAPSMTALLSGETSVQTSNVLSMVPHVRAGRLKPLGVTSSKRAASAPEVPTIAESGLPAYESVQWLGLVAPAKTPREIIARLNRETNALVRAAEIRERLARDGAEAVGTTPEEFAAYIQAETAKWAKVIKAAGIQPE
jgi:tripartite-type tricarboxylate transporter receptor subunit TctC